jgi:hypothetical protein
MMLAYQVQSLQHVDKDWARVTLHCIGYPSKETHPDEWNFVLKVPMEQIERWPLGMMVKLSVSGTPVTRPEPLP